MKRLKELLEQLTLHFQVEIAISDILEDHESRIKKREDMQLRYDTRFNKLERQYGEMMLVLADINKKLKTK